MAEGSSALYGGRFLAKQAQAMVELSRSTHFDWALAPYDLVQSKAHARSLHRAGLLSDEESAQMQAALAQIAGEVASGALAPEPADEDVHSVLERRLREILGEHLGGKLRAGRSRNDQVATDFRLFLRDHARRIAADVLDLAEALREQAERHVDDVAPGFTHLQRAQPVSFGHELGKHVQALLRDVERVQDWDGRAALSPMGAGALSGSSLPLDPVAVAAELGFDGVLANSIDAVSDRDFVAEFLFVAAMLGVHVSRLGEEICLWASTEFGWAGLDDRFATGSSIMPQKKNPDSAELARGKSGRLIGNLVALLTAAKGLPFAYNRDLQEDKEPVMDTVATLALVLPAMTGTVATLTFRPEVMAASAPAGFALATEIADWLVVRGVPFRAAHEASGRCVKTAEESGCDLTDLTEQQLAAAHPALTLEVRQVLDVHKAVAARVAPGGTAPVRVREQLQQAGQRIDDLRAWCARNPVQPLIRV